MFRMQAYSLLQTDSHHVVVPEGVHAMNYVAHNIAVLASTTIMVVAALAFADPGWAFLGLAPLLFLMWGDEE